MSFLPASSCWLPYCFNGLAGWHIALMVITKIMMIIDYFSSYVWLATVIKLFPAFSSTCMDRCGD
jgi:hypothetical protein